jgi:glutamate formiminotransferase
VSRRFEPIEPLQQGERFVRRRAAIDCRLQQAARLVAIAALERGDAVLQQLFRLALPFRERAARPFDVRARAGVAAVEKQRPRPDVDRVLVAAREIMVETDEEQLFDLCVAIGPRRRLGRVSAVGAMGLGHGAGGLYPTLRIAECGMRNADCGLRIADFSYVPIYNASVIRNPKSEIRNSMALIECIPNVSEGRRPDVVAALADTIRAVPHVRLLDHSSDASHNRSVFTLVGDAAGVEQAVLALFERAIADIDLRTHRGEHPRLGAVDVVPFVPIEGVTMAECVALAKKVAAEVAERFGVPVFLYEEASTNPARTNLEDIRRGEFEGLTAKMAEPGWAPDFGPATPHATAGATVIGARMALIAYNINLATDRIDVAKKIAAAIRYSSGGYRYVKAAGFKLEERGIVQVSMNLTNYENTPIFRVFETVKREAARYGVSILESEIVGLVPAAALNATAEFYLQIAGFTPDQVLENRLRSSKPEVRSPKSEVRS